MYGYKQWRAATSSGVVSCLTRLFRLVRPVFLRLVWPTCLRLARPICFGAADVCAFGAADLFGAAFGSA